MSLRLRFISFAVFVHAILLGLALWILPHSRLLFVAVEVLTVLTLLWTVHLYRSLLKPISLIATGVETIRDKDFQSKFLPTGQRELDELIDVYNRMIDQLRDERTKQREQHYFLERLIHATPTGILILDLDDKVNLINPAGEHLLRASVDHVLGRSCNDLPGPLGFSLKDMKPGETRVVNISGVSAYRCRKSHFLDRGFHRHFLVIEELTQEILGAQKRAYTSVIRMMSHEVNNTVGAVNSILQSSLGYSGHLPDGDREEFEHAFGVAIDRNNGLNSFMTKLASVVRIPPPAMERYDLHEILRSVHVLFRDERRGRNIKWDWQLGNDVMELNIDVHQLEQVIINIVRNALEAIDHDGTIRVTTIPASGFLSIEDDGPGIAPEVRERLFAPFYSTKRDGQGVGLTLVTEILSNHNCNFNLEQREEGGAVFWIEFVQLKV